VTTVKLADGTLCNVVLPADVGDRARYWLPPDWGPMDYAGIKKRHLHAGKLDLYLAKEGWVALVDAAPPPVAKPLLTQDKKARKETPIARGVVDYFPRALAAVARVSYVANEQHNPGEPMHWDKSKSTDHADCIARHLIERGTVDDDGLRHSAKLAWRALALLETELEAAK
jgi:hypothetical protein